MNDLFDTEKSREVERRGAVSDADRTALAESEIVRAACEARWLADARASVRHAHLIGVLEKRGEAAQAALYEAVNEIYRRRVGTRTAEKVSSG